MDVRKQTSPEPETSKKETSPSYYAIQVEEVAQFE